MVSFSVRYMKQTRIFTVRHGLLNIKGDSGVTQPFLSNLRFILYHFCSICKERKLQTAFSSTESRENQLIFTLRPMIYNDHSNAV